jgi:hypothetical protein
LTLAHRPTIAIVVTFFGTPPIWLPAFFRSCQTNPDVRWLIYSDFDVPTPSNVTIKRMELREFSARASETIGTTITIEQALVRKICDFKPLYGLMFADDLRDFEFWAYSDLDVIWGSIRQFATDELLNEHIILSPRQRKLGGHGTFFRNTEANNRLFELVPDVISHLTNPHYVRVDENLLTRALRDLIARTSFKARPKIYWEDEMTITAQYQKELLASERDWQLPWRDGHAFDAEGREVMYVHFHKLVLCLKSIDFGFGDQPRAFSLRPIGIVTDQDPVLQRSKVVTRPAQPY